MTAEETDVKTTVPELSESKEKVTWYNGKHVLEIDFSEEFLLANQCTI